MTMGTSTTTTKCPTILGREDNQVFWISGQLPRPEWSLLRPRTSVGNDGDGLDVTTMSSVLNVTSIDHDDNDDLGLWYPLDDSKDLMTTTRTSLIFVFLLLFYQMEEDSRSKMVTKGHRLVLTFGRKFPHTVYIRNLSYQTLFSSLPDSRLYFGRVLLQCFITKKLVLFFFLRKNV